MRPVLPTSARLDAGKPFAERLDDIRTFVREAFPVATDCHWGAVAAHLLALADGEEL